MPMNPFTFAWEPDPVEEAPEAPETAQPEAKPKPKPKPAGAKPKANKPKPKG